MLKKCVFCEKKTTNYLYGIAVCYFHGEIVLEFIQAYLKHIASLLKG